MKCPCKGCDHRKLGCHGFCNEYKEWRIEIDERNRNRQKENDSRQLSRDHELKYRRNLKEGVYK